MQTSQDNGVLEALQFRHACKRFDSARAIESADFEQILEAGRLSPSSFGMEHWRFNVIAASKREAMAQLCWNQPQITEAAELVAISTVISAVDSDTDYVREKFYREGMDPETTETYISGYNDFVDHACKPNSSLYAWGSKQCYIALANMMTAAAAIGIDSCPIEGFQAQPVDALLGFDQPDVERVVVLLALGYRLNPQGPRFRVPLSALIRHIA